MPSKDLVKPTTKKLKKTETNTVTESVTSVLDISIELPNISLNSISDIQDEITPPNVQDIVEKIEGQLKIDTTIVEEKAEEVKEEVEEKVEEVKEMVEDKVEEVKEEVEEKVEEVKELVEEKVEEVKELVEEKVEEVKELVEEKVEETLVQVEQKVVDEVNTKCKSFAFILPIISKIFISIKTLLKSNSVKSAKAVAVAEVTEPKTEAV